MKQLSTQQDAWLAEKQRQQNAAEDAALRRAIAVAHAELECRCALYGRSPTKAEYHAAYTKATNQHWDDLRAKKNARR